MMRREGLIAALGVALGVILGVAGPPGLLRNVAGQSPTQPPFPSTRVGIPGSANLAPSSAVTFFRAPCEGLPSPSPSPGQFPVHCPAPPSILTVAYVANPASTARVDVAYDGVRLTLTAPAGVAVRVEPPDEAACTAADGEPSVVQCRLPPNLSRMSPVRFTTATVAPVEMIALAEGCNNVVLTWPNGTSPATVAAAVTPRTALSAIWRLDSATSRFRAWSPLPSAPNDLTSFNRLDAVFICMQTPGALSRPAL